MRTTNAKLCTAWPADHRIDAYSSFYFVSFFFFFSIPIVLFALFYLLIRYFLFFLFFSMSVTKTELA